MNNELTLEQIFNDIRAESLVLDKKVAALELHKELLVMHSVKAIEVINNIVLAYRHYEDGRMRIGKALQALQGGVSKYDNVQK